MASDSTSTQTRFALILQSIAVLAAELGPVFIHSAHGISLLQKGEETLMTLAPVFTGTATVPAAQ